jgi:hypothetical protein
MASALFKNPLQVIVSGNTPYDLVLTLDSNKKLTIANQTVKEGETLNVIVSANDFKIP